MNLPRKDENGTPYISYSQIKAWNEAKGFNTGGLGRHEFILTYFLSQNYGDKNGFAQFGTDVENYICGDVNAKCLFTDKEKETLDKIAPLGTFQQKIKIPFEEGFYLTGYIDDTNHNFTKIRDYKSASEKSKAQYETDEYKQLDIYALGIKDLTGKLPKELEVCVIERIGNGFRGGRDVMSVGENIWYIKRETNTKRLKELKEYIVKTALEISKYYTIFQKLNN